MFLRCSSFIFYILMFFFYNIVVVDWRRCRSYMYINTRRLSPTHVFVICMSEYTHLGMSLCIFFIHIYAFYTKLTLTYIIYNIHVFSFFQYEYEFWLYEFFFIHFFFCVSQNVFSTRHARKMKHKAIKSIAKIQFKFQSTSDYVYERSRYFAIPAKILPLLAY